MCRLLRGGVDWNIRDNEDKLTDTVASFAEAWIEINSAYLLLIAEFVASFAEAWIEIINKHAKCGSPPSRRRGLKLVLFIMNHSLKRRLLRGGVDWNLDEMDASIPEVLVASFAEAWIEIGNTEDCYLITECRFLRGGVDWNFAYCYKLSPLCSVASFVEAWIEIGNPHCSSRCCYIVSSQR